MHCTRPGPKVKPSCMRRSPWCTPWCRMGRVKIIIFFIFYEKNIPHEQGRKIMTPWCMCGRQCAYIPWCNKMTQCLHLKCICHDARMVKILHGPSTKIMAPRTCMYVCMCGAQALHHHDHNQPKDGRSGMLYQTMAPAMCLKRWKKRYCLSSKHEPPIVAPIRYGM